MQLQPVTQNQPERFAHDPIPRQEKFNIYHGKGNSKLCQSEETTLLPIQYVVYETLVRGINAAIQDRDFKGAMLIDYDLNGEKHHIVFAMWYSKSEHLYFLTSLGQYSARDFRRGMRHFKTANEVRLKIKLAPIHPEGLADLREKLLRSNLSGANVCLIDATIESKS
ncbi:MAG: hypothetical protein L0Y43_03335 [Methylococcaceae bacterium]|nr:hypothetical protein [Methylococcaceae bacterium]